MLFKGAGTAIVTPFTDKGEVNFEELEKLVNFQIEEGIDAIIAAGTTGEASTLTNEEQQEMVQFVVEKVNGRVPVIGGAGSNDTAHGVTLSRMIKDAGVDGLLHQTPYYNKSTQKGFIQHMEEMVKEVGDLPIILYDVPGRTAMNILPKTVLELSKIDSIVGIKDATGSLANTLEIKRLLPEDFAIYSGNDDLILPLLACGGHGVISVVSNCLPKETSRLCHAFFEGKTDEALDIQLKYKAFIDSLFVEVNPIPVKAALEIMGYDMGAPKLPLTRAEESTFELLRENMKEVGLIE